MNDAYLLADFLEDNRQWTSQETTNLAYAEAIFFASLFDYEFNLEPLNGEAFIQTHGINVLLGGKHVFERLQGTHIEYWIGGLNAIIHGERVCRGFIKQCIHNGSLKIILQKFDCDDFYNNFPEERDSHCVKSHEDNTPLPLFHQSLMAINHRRTALGVKPYIPNSNKQGQQVETPPDTYFLTPQEYMIQKMLRNNQGR